MCRCSTEAPDVRREGVVFAGEPLRRHVDVGADEGVAHLGCAFIPTQGEGANRDGFMVLVSATSPLFRNSTFAHDLPHTSWVERKVHLNTEASPSLFEMPKSVTFTQPSELMRIWARL